MNALIRLVNIGGLSGLHNFTFRKGVSVVRGRNTSGKSSVVRGLRLISGYSRTLEQDLLFSGATSGMAGLKIGRRAFGVSLRRLNKSVIAIRQRTIDRNPATKEIAVIDWHNRLITSRLEPNVIREFISDISGGQGRQSEREQIVHKIKYLDAKIPYYMKMRKLYHGHKKDAERLSRAIARLQKKRRKLLRNRGLKPYTVPLVNHYCVTKAGEVLDKQCDNLMDMAANLDLEGASFQQRCARRKYESCKMRFLRFRMMGKPTNCNVMKMKSMEWKIVKEARKQYLEAQRVFRWIKMKIRSEEDKVDDAYARFQDAGKRYLNKVSSIRRGLPLDVILRNARAKLFVLNEINKRYDHVRDEQKRINSEIIAFTIRRNKLDNASRKLFLTGINEFNKLGPTIINKYFNDLYTKLWINKDFSITLKKMSRIRPLYSTSEICLIAISLALAVRNAYRPTFPFMAIDIANLDTRRLLAVMRSISKFVPYVICTSTESVPLDVVYC